MSSNMFLMVFFAFFLFSNPPTVFSATENPQAPKKNLYYLFNYRWFTTPKSQNTENVLHQLSMVDQEEGPNRHHVCRCKPTHPPSLAPMMLLEDHQEEGPQPKRRRCPPCPHPPALAPSAIVPEEEDDMQVGPNMYRCRCKTRPYRCHCPHSPAPAPSTAMVHEEEDDILDEVPNKRRCHCPHHPPSIAPTMFLDGNMEEGPQKIRRCRCPRNPSPAPAPSAMLPEEEDDLNEEVPNKHHHCHCKPHHAPGLAPTMVLEDQEPQKKKKNHHCHCNRHHHPPASAPHHHHPHHPPALSPYHHTPRHPAPSPRVN